MSKESWNLRYRASDYVYGKEPNAFLKEKLPSLEPQRVLFACEGEGRNSVFAAQLGWEVTAFDQSEAGKVKAEGLAREKGVSIDYQLSSVDELALPGETFDLLVLIYVHFPREVRRAYYQKLLSYLKPGGKLIVEGFASGHENYQATHANIGGPRDSSMFLSAADAGEDFPGLNFTYLKEQEVELSEGQGHLGKGWVLRMEGVKL